MEEEDRLTKSQRRRRNQKTREDFHRHLWDMPGPKPAWLKDPKTTKSKAYNGPVEETQENWERAPSHVVEISEDEYVLNTGKLKGMSQIAGKSRTDERDQKRAELKLKYGHYWDKPDGAQKIVNAEKKAGNKISSRTVRRYFQQTRK